MRDRIEVAIAGTLIVAFTLIIANFAYISLSSTVAPEVFAQSVVVGLMAGVILSALDWLSERK